MADVQECPLCGGTMHIHLREIVVQVPGNPQPTRRVSREWVCPDCDYFEEAEPER